MSNFPARNINSSPSYFAQLAISGGRGRGPSPMEGVVGGSTSGGHEEVVKGSRGGGHTLVACGSRGGGHAGVVGGSRDDSHDGVGCARGGGYILLPCGSGGGGHVGGLSGSRGGGHAGVVGGSRDGGREGVGRARGGGHTLVPCGSKGGGRRGVAGGSRGGGHVAVAGGTSKRIDALGRLLGRVLRHMATELKLDMRSDGYVKVGDLLKLNLTSKANVPLGSHTIDEIREAVRIDNKQRFGLLEEGGQLLIRANQGHTVQVVKTESLLRPITSAEEIPVCVHGTYKRFLDSILTSGIHRMKRLHVHFSVGLPSDGEVISGIRNDVNVVIFLDVKKAMEDGMKFYKSANNVILTEGFSGVVPAKYFQEVQLWPSRNPVPFQI